MTKEMRRMLPNLIGNEKIKNLLEGCVAKLGGHRGSELIFELNCEGTRVSARAENGTAEYEKLLALCCLNEMRNGRETNTNLKKRNRKNTYSDPQK